MVDTLGYGRKHLIKHIVEDNWNVEKAESKVFNFNELLFVVQELLTEEGKAYMEKRSPRQGHIIFRHFVQHLLYRNIANYDSMILITSEKGCITGDALLKTEEHPNGIALKRLVGSGPFKVYSYNIKYNKVELKKCDGVEFVKIADICKIKCNDGSTLAGTYDHPIMKKNKKYVKLIDSMTAGHFNNTQLITPNGFKSVKKISYPKKQAVFDVVNVRDNHNFIVNGFVVSNTGKSSAAMMLAREWMRLLGRRFDSNKHIAYNNADVMYKIDALDKFSPIICDEAIRFASACIVGDTLIKTPNGNIQIKKLVGKENFEVYSFNKKTKQQEIQKAEKCIKVKDDIVYEIETEDGQKIQATKEHNFLTNKGWRTLGELQEGDDLVDV